ncbi:MAG: alpha-ketoacid dehydrogenase subunit beta [Candidatus Limnocylindria bacterium]
MSTLTERQTTNERDDSVGGVELTYRQAITAALDDEMSADASVVLLGEDVGAAGGVFKTNEGLIEKFGPQRVINTPISENGFVGVALGMAVSGLRPVVEIMFSDFLPSAGDAIVNELPKFRFMSGGQTSVPVTVRSIAGGTGRFGTQHSATGESWYIGLPGLRVAVAGSPGAAYELLRFAIQHDNPVLFFEHKGLYARKGPVRRGTVATFGRADVVRSGSDVSIAATLLMVERSLTAAAALADEGINAEVIDLRWLSPLDLDTVHDSVERTRRLVIAEEQVHAGGWGATLISRLAGAGIRFASPPRAVSLPDNVLIPYSPALEDAIIPTPERIAEAARATVRG